MSTDNQKQPQQPPAGNPGWMSALGWLFTLLVAAFFLGFGTMKVIESDLMKPPEQSLNNGWLPVAFVGLGIVELVVGVVYLFPPTCVLGAILATGYLGGAVATHVRIGDAFSFPFLIGVLVWLGPVLRKESLRAALPWGRDPAEPPGGCLAAIGKIFLVLLAIAGAIAAIATAMPTDYRVQRSIKIAAPASDIFPHVNDFTKWKPWNPFLEKDPDCPVTPDGAGKGATYKWNSEKGFGGAGEGKMTIVESEPNERIKIDLEFIRPLPHSAEAEFTFKQEGDETVVTWSISGKRDYKLKVLHSIMPMDMMLGEIFMKGLTRMKDEAKKK